MDQKLAEKVEQARLLEASLYNILMQKQTLQQQLDEIENALRVLDNIGPGEKVYKMVGNILIEKDKSKLVEDLKSLKELLEVRISSLDKQEQRLKEKLEKLQEELQKLIK